ncbi:ORF6N domain-containing protein [Rhodocytophaga aerolata]|uniref:ORF6N domain-containing protein n=1 Tax=Rhodocytophaga aerolata TaxID=455078 RepID=A0ABT8RE82_9BACT|nr:ORF6N domain-containing protein [Rhodocytophaga aerolata]MDO1450360.1 ORF6N domain-containing protein [Rhodocytophaga aerolata]
MTDNRISHHRQAVITTELLAEKLGININNLMQNFNNNAERYLEGVHYYKLTGDALKDFRNQYPELKISGRIRNLFLWTEKGCFNHVKSLGTEEAWDSYQLLVETYFRQRTQLAKKSASLNLPSTQEELLLEAVKLMVEQKKELTKHSQEIGSLQKDVREIMAKVDITEKEYYTVNGYHKLHSRYIRTDQAQALGRKCGKLSRSKNIPIVKVYDARYGTVNTYHVQVLKEVLGF